MMIFIDSQASAVFWSLLKGDKRVNFRFDIDKVPRDVISVPTKKGRERAYRMERKFSNISTLVCFFAAFVSLMNKQTEKNKNENGKKKRETDDEPT